MTAQAAKLLRNPSPKGEVYPASSTRFYVVSVAETQSPGYQTLKMKIKTPKPKKLRQYA
jgi:hypothetical protein